MCVFARPWHLQNPCVSAGPQSLQHAAPVTRTSSATATCHGMGLHIVQKPASCTIYLWCLHGFHGAGTACVPPLSSRPGLHCSSLHYHICPTQHHCLFRGYCLIVGLSIPIYIKTEAPFFLTSYYVNVDQAIAFPEPVECVH